jgi:hypothetical protein
MLAIAMQLRAGDAEISFQGGINTYGHSSWRFVFSNLTDVEWKEEHQLRNDKK